MKVNELKVGDKVVFEQVPGGSYLSTHKVYNVANTGKREIYFRSESGSGTSESRAMLACTGVSFHCINTAVSAVMGSHFDYVNQAWTVDGKYIACSHPESMHCNCYGTMHAGKVAPLENLPTAAMQTDIATLTAAYRADGKGYMLAKFRGICESRKMKYWEAAALIDAVWQSLVPGNDKAARLARLALIKA